MNIKRYKKNLTKDTYHQLFPHILNISFIYAFSIFLSLGCTPSTIQTTLVDEISSDMDLIGVIPHHGGDSTSVAGEESSNGGAESVSRPHEPIFIPAPATLHRISTDEIVASVRTLFGVVPVVDFEQETSLHGFVRVANSELTISPVLTEQLETFAWELADILRSDEERLRLHFPCPLQTGEEGESPQPPCIRSSIVELGLRLWRRPLETTEIDRLFSLYQELRRDTFTRSTHYHSISGVVAALLQAPDFAFRIEIGEPDQLTVSNQTWRYTNYEMAARLSYLFWGTGPDEQLLNAAHEQRLVTDEGLEIEIRRLLDDPRSIDRFNAYFEELIGLKYLDVVSKNIVLFPLLTSSLRTSMRTEVVDLFTSIVFDRDTDFRELLTSSESSVDQELATLYGVSPSQSISAGERISVTFPEQQQRGGLLGRAAPLTLFSHATVNSPTYRGRFIRSGLLCQDVPPPPEGVVTELEESTGTEEQTLRQRLEQHAIDPQCAGCHRLMDPLGYALEHFDPIGQWRELDNGLPIDTSGDLDGSSIDGAVELGQAIADSPYFSSCMTKRLYRYAVGHLEDFDEYPLIDELDDRFTSEGAYRFKSLLISIVMSDGFRRLSAPQAEVDDQGQEIQIEGCGGVERCDGTDNDCDGEIDESVIQSCLGRCGASGVQTCMEGEWTECEVGDPPTEICDGEDNDCDGEIDESLQTFPELCDGEDNDCDGEIDEEVNSAIHDVGFERLTRFHDGCRVDSRDPSSCNAAINRFCSSLGCGGSGFGPIESGWQSISLLCLPNDMIRGQQVSYADLSARHGVCDGQREAIGPNCNAAIHRHCNQTGLQTGFGPLERGPINANIACVPQATIVQTSYTELSQHHGDCHQNGERIGFNCNAAIHRLCSAQGYLSGWGPLENSGDVAYVACVN